MRGNLNDNEEYKESFIRIIEHTIKTVDTLLFHNNLYFLGS